MRTSWTTRPAAVALLAVALVFAWQALTVHLNYGGNWTALFCTGERLRVPPELASEGIYRFPASTGYDGQFYHYMAHDPFLRKGFAEYMDDPALRYRRLLVPALAYLLALGQDRYIDTALFGVVWLSILLGAYWLARYAVVAGRSAVWGLGFLVVPAAIITIDRTVVDATLAALVAGFALYAGRGGRRLYLILTCACLTRETGVLLAAGYVVFLLWSRLPLKACLYATSALPALAWARFVGERVRPGLMEEWMAGAPPPVFGKFMAFRMARYDLPDPVAWTLHALDWIMLVAIVAAMALAVRSVLRASRSPLAFAGLAYAGFMLVTMRLAEMRDPFAYARLSSPLLLLAAMGGFREGWRWGWVPLAAVSLRTAAQLAPQALGLLRGLHGG